jgi:pyruvate formate lyase activating enzyme
MLIGALQKFSLIDYPGKICATIFTQTCNFRCPYCHNPELVLQELFVKPLSEKSIFEFLDNRKGKLDGITITGGEPTIHKDLPDFIRKIKEMGFLVKLDTNGTNPKMLEYLFHENLIDFTAMDLKAPIQIYDKISRNNCQIDNIINSVKIIKKKSPDYEFRTTIVNDLLSENDIYQIEKDFGPFKKYSLQKFHSDKILDLSFEKKTSFPDKILENIKDKIKVKNFQIR